MKKINDEQLILFNHRFKIDYEAKLFQYHKRQQQVIPFSAFKDNGNGERHIDINRLNGSLSTGVLDPVYDIRIALPEVMFKGPFMDSPEPVCTLNADGPKGNFRILDHDQRVRIDQGKLPLLTMGAGDIWVYDGRLNQIRNSEPPSNSIWLDFMEKSADLKHQSWYMIHVIKKKVNWTGEKLLN